MGPGFRYHVATIVAIFLALGVGMVIGSSHLQEALVERLRIQLRELNERFTNEIQPLRKDNEEKSKALGILAARVTRNALKDIRVALVVTGDYGDAAQQAADAMRKAGAALESTTVIPPSFPMRLDVGLPALLPALKGALEDPQVDGRSLVFRRLASLIAFGGAPQIRKRFEEANLIEPNGSYGSKVNAVVLIGGARDVAERRWQTVDYPLIDQLLALGATVIGAEPSDAAQTYIPAYQAKGISTVDNVETEIGRTCLVLLVRGDRGSYGMKKTARDGLLPLGTVAE